MKFPKIKVQPYEITVATCIAVTICSLLRVSMIHELKKSLFAYVEFPFTSDGSPRQLPINVRSALMPFNETSHYGLHDVREWESLTPPGNGWVTLEPGPKAYAVAMYHQLHCLNAMRYDLTQSMIGKKATAEELGHAHHCYNYLRQGLQCGLDVTLELSHDELGGTVHVCRDWVQIREFMEQNYKTYPMFYT